MSYFNHSFTKRFLVTGETFKKGDKIPGTNLTSPVDVNSGFIVGEPSSNFTTADLAKFPPGYLGIFDAKTYQSYNQSYNPSVTRCCPYIIAGSSILSNDKIGPFHGGYKETNKSKVVNPKYVQRVYGVEACLPEQAVLHIGQTNLNGIGKIVDITVVNTTGTLADGVYTSGINGDGYGATLQITVLDGDITNVIVSNPGLGYVDSVGTTNVIFTDGTQTADLEITYSATKVGAGSECCPTFCCEKDYYLRIDIKGSPALRFANHNLYRNLLAQGGSCCNSTITDLQIQGGAAAIACPDLKEAICDVCTPVDPTLIYLQWANAIVTDPYLKDFINPVVFDWTGLAWYAPGTNGGVQEWSKTNSDGTVTNLYALSPSAIYWSSICNTSGSGSETEAAPTPFTSGPTIPGGTGLYPPIFSSEEQWVSFLKDNGLIDYSLLFKKGCCAGLRLEGAYVDTKFGNCSFQITDFFEKEPIKLYASLVDIKGNPCFNQICVVNECLGKQGIGFGEQVLRDLIVSESYLQNYFHTDIRIREITQGNDILNFVNRNAMYDRLYLQHSVPRFNNPTGVFDNDRYLLEIITPQGIGKNVLEQFREAFAKCNNCPDVELYSCSTCNTLPVPVAEFKISK